MEERMKSIVPVNQVAKEYSETKEKKANCGTEFTTKELAQAYMEGAEMVIKLFEEELNWHNLPEHGYFCDCIQEIIMKLKGEQ